MSVVAVVPARGGSQRVPRKNLASCAGKPLIAWTAEAVLAARSVDRVLLSTDDEEIAAVGHALGLEVPFLRPSELADGEAPMLSVMQHALDWVMAEDMRVGALVLLQPTSPLRTAVHIDEAVAMLRENGADTVVSVVAAPHNFHPLKALRRNGDGTLAPYLDDAPGQGQTVGLALAPAYGRNGPAVLATRPAVVAGGSLYGPRCLPYIMEPEDSVDIDEPYELLLAECLLHRRRGSGREGAPR